MAGPVEWAALIFIGGLLIAAIVSSWRARSLLASFQLGIELRLASLEKDMRHTKKAVEHHAAIHSEVQMVERLKGTEARRPKR